MEEKVKPEAKAEEPKVEAKPVEEKPAEEKPAEGNPQTPVQVVVKEKSHGGLIALIVVLALLLGAVVTLLVMQFTGQIQLQNLFSGGGFSSIFGGGETTTGKNSFGGIGAGQYGGTSSNSAVPTVESAKKVCEAYGNVWEEVEDLEDLSMDEMSTSHVTGAYMCDLADEDSDDFTDDTFIFEIVFTNTDFNNVDYYTKTIKNNVDELPSDGVVLENNDEFVKMYIPMYSGGYHFIVAYKNAAIELAALSMETANKVLAAIGFPDRSYSDPGEYVDKDEDYRDTEAKRDIRKVAKALKEFYDDYGRYPEYEFEGVEPCTDIYGNEIRCGLGIMATRASNSIEAEDFFRDYIGELSHPRDSISPSNLNFYASVDAMTDEYRWNHDQSIIEIFFNARCESDTKIVANDGGFAVTIPKYQGQVYFCAD